MLDYFVLLKHGMVRPRQYEKIIFQTFFDKILTQKLLENKQVTYINDKYILIIMKKNYRN